MTRKLHFENREMGFNDRFEIIIEKTVTSLELGRKLIAQKSTLGGKFI